MDIYKSIKDVIGEENIEIEIIDDIEVIIYINDTMLNFSFDKNNLDGVIEKIKYFFSYKYIPEVGLLNKNYAELPIFIHDFEVFDEVDNYNNLKDGIYYKIGRISEDYWKTMKMNDEEILKFRKKRNLSTLKIYNIDNNIEQDYKNDNFIEKVLNIAGSLLFELSAKYDVLLELDSFNWEENIHKEHEDIINEFEAKLSKIEKNKLEAIYDNDLISYYLRASEMSESKFKYLAYYQVIECIFDEVHMNKTILDIRQIINSDWFSSYNNSHIKEIVKLVDKYNVTKNDRDKLRLVLENYFKGELHDEAYYLANKSIISLLKEMNKIKKDSQINDLQRIANIIYDFRCECTHSNREYSFRTSFNSTSEELNNYIRLIKKIVQRVIMNYKANNI